MRDREAIDTFSCYRRLPLLKTMRARNLFVHALGRIRERYKFLLVGYVVMPNHMHLLISESSRGTPSVVLKVYVVMPEHVHLLLTEPVAGNPSKVIQVFKQRVSRRMRNRRARRVRGQLRLPFAEQENGPKRFWQRRFYDFNVCSRGKLKEKLNYMHANPAGRKLVKHPKDWPWSSWGFYEKGGMGLIRVDPVN